MRACARLSNLYFASSTNWAARVGCISGSAPEKIQLPTVIGGTGSAVRWQAARYHSLLSLLQNPVYAGAYAYGRTRTQVHLAQGRKQVSRTKRRAPADWRVLITAHHEGYISWEEYQRIQTLIAHNAVAHGGAVRGPVRSGQALLVGLLRCGHCGRKLHVEYPSQGHTRYACMSFRLDPDGICCVRTNGLQADELVGEETLRCLSPLGIEAASAALRAQQDSEDDRIRQKSLAVEQAPDQNAQSPRRISRRYQSAPMSFGEIMQPQGAGPGIGSARKPPHRSSPRGQRPSQD